MSAYSINYQYRNWLTKAPVGLLLTGLGASMISDAAITRYSGAPTLRWLGYGTLALTIFNGGLSVLADAAKHRAHYERLRDAPPEPDGLIPG